MATCSFKLILKFFPTSCPPSLRLGGIEEILFDGRFYTKRKFRIDLVDVLKASRTPGARDGYIQFLRKTVGIPLVPSPFRYLPFRSGHAIHLLQNRLVAREGHYEFVSCREKDPAVQVQLFPQIEQKIDGTFLIAQADRPNSSRRIFRETADRVFVVNNHDGYTMSSETADNR